MVKKYRPQSCWKNSDCSIGCCAYVPENRREALRCAIKKWWSGLWPAS